MSRAQAWFSHVTTVLVGGTGLVYGWMRWFAEPADEFALVNHPWQPELQALHLLFAPLSVFAVGLLWSDHVWARVRGGHPGRRRGGLTLMALFFPMVARGYLLQVTTSDLWLRAWTWLHVATSIGWLVVYAAHQVAPRGPDLDALERELEALSDSHTIV